ncbi:MAG: hypothetical protein LBI69_01765 [Puniceicoccales bacterium]|jgi:hypothetical protein|nr:hypothetical protein [Puniceicoccales bacterium]
MSICSSILKGGKSIPNSPSNPHLFQEDEKGQFKNPNIERFALQMLIPESIRGSSFDGYNELEGIHMGHNMLNYIKSSEYFSDTYKPAFDNALKIFTPTDQFFKEDQIIKILYKNLDNIFNNIITRDAGSNSYTIKSLESFLGGNEKSAVSQIEQTNFAIKNFDEKIREFALNRAKSYYGETTTSEMEGDMFHIKIGETGKWTANFSINNQCDILKEEIVKIFSDTFNQIITIDNSQDRFMVPFGYTHNSSGHQTFAYVKKIKDLWCVQEINFGAGMPDVIIDSNYCKLTTFGRCLFLSETNIKKFLMDVHISRAPKQSRNDAEKCYCNVWSRYEFEPENTDKNLPNDTDIPWNIISFKAAQKSGNCVMRSVEGLAEVILLDCFQAIDQAQDDTLNAHRKDKKLANTITLKCYEIVSRLAILEQYHELSLPKNFAPKDILTVLKSAVEQLGTSMKLLRGKLERYNSEGRVVELPYLKKKFFDKLTENYSSLCGEINTHVNSNESKNILYEKYESWHMCTYLKDRKYNINLNKYSMKELSNLYSNSTTSIHARYISHAIAQTNFQDIKNGNFTYIVNELSSLLREAGKNETCAKFATRKMMKIIQNIPFNHEGLSELEALESINLLKLLRNCLAFIDNHCSAYGKFFETSSSPGVKDSLIWQLHDEQTNFNEYDSTKAVNAHAVASIVVFNIISKNKNFLGGRGELILAGCTFDFKKYLEYYNSFSCYIHNHEDVEVIRKIITHFEGEKEKKIVFNFTENRKANNSIDIFSADTVAQTIKSLIHETTAEKKLLAMLKNDNKISDEKTASNLLAVLICHELEFHIGRRYSKIKRDSLEASDDNDIILLLSLFHILSGGISIEGQLDKNNDGTVNFCFNAKISYSNALNQSTKNADVNLLYCDSENKIRCLKEIRMDSENVLPLARIDCLNEDTRTINLLHRLQRNLGICNAFGNLKNTNANSPNDDSESMQKSNYYLMHFFEQTMQDFSIGKIGNTIQHNLKDPRPIEKNAKSNFNELIDAVNALEHDGIEKFCTRVPFNQISASSLAMVMHYKSLVLRNIITQHKTDENTYKMLLEILTNHMEKIINLEKYIMNGENANSDAKYYIAIMENECILNMLELNSVEETGENRLEAWQKPINVKYIKRIIFNSYMLKQFNARGLPKGCLYAANDACEILDRYWMNHPNAAKKIAGELCKHLNIAVSELTQYGESNNNAIFQSDNIFIDLLTLSIHVNGKILTACQSCISDDDDCKRLFGDKQFEIVRNGDFSFFKDETFGAIEVRRNEHGNYVSILCDLDGDQNQWLFLGKMDTKDSNFENLKFIPSYFICSDFNIFIAKNGFIRIYENNPLGRLLFETIETKINGESTYVLKSYREQDNGYFVAFSGPLSSTSTIQPFENTCLSLFEDKECIGALYDNDGKIVRIFFPRLKDSNGNEIFLTPLKEPDETYSWRWNGNKNYKLCLGIATPLLDGYGIPMESNNCLHNPLINFTNYLCLENTDSNSMKSYKFLIPRGTYRRKDQFMHQYNFAFASPKLDGEIFWKSECLGEVSFSCDPVIFCEKPMTGNTPLGTLRIAQAFQIQGEYENAIKYLQLLSTNGAIGKDEIAVFRDMILWFIDGEERSPKSANFIFRAIGRMLQWDASSMGVRKLLGSIKFFPELIATYLSGYDHYSILTEMSFEKEISLWRQLKFHLDLDQIKKINLHLEVLEKVHKEKLTLSENISSYYKNKEVHQKKDELYFFLRESEKVRAISLRESENIQAMNGIPFNDASAEINEEEATKRKICKLAEREIAKNAREIFKIEVNDPNKVMDISDSPQENSSSAQRYDILGKNNSDEAFNASTEFQSDLEAFQSEMDASGCEQTKRQNDPFLNENFFKNIAETALGNFSNSLKNKTTDLRAATSELVKKIGDLLCAGKFETTFGSGKWSSVNIPEDIHRIFGYYAGGHKKRALKYIRDRNPAFDVKKLSILNEAIEDYISGINSIRHIQKINDALYAFSKDRNNFTWGTVVALIRSLRDDSSDEFKADDVGKRNKLIYQFSLILEMMSQIRLRPDQIEKIYFTLETLQGEGDGENKVAVGALIQQLMGSGKSKALIPALVLMGLCLKKKRSKYDDGSNEDSCYFGYPVIVSHSTQLPSVLKELPAIFSELGIVIEAIHLDFKSLKSVNGMRSLYEKLNDIVKERTRIPVFTSNELMALLAIFNSIDPELNKNTNEYLIEYAKVMGILNKCTSIFDEIHLTANPKEAFIIEAAPNGKKDTMQIGDNEIKAVTDFIFNCLPDKLLTACKNNQQSLIAKLELRNQLKVAVEKKLTSMDVGFSDNDEKSLFLKFMVGELDGQSETNPESIDTQQKINKIMKQFEDGDKLKSILALRAMATNLIPHCFSKVYTKDFGYDSVTGEVIPYANFQPSKSKFQNPWEIICFSCLSILSGGFSQKTIYNFVMQLHNGMNNEISAEIKFHETNSFKMFEIYFKKLTHEGELLHLNDAVEMNKEHKYCISDKILNAIRRYASTPDGRNVTTTLSQKVCTSAAVWNTSSYSTSPSTVIENVFHSAIGATGTTYNRSAFPLCMEEHYSPQTGSLGAVCSKFVENNENKHSHIHAISPETMDTEETKTPKGISVLTAENLLRQWKMNVQRANPNDAEAVIKNLRIIVDSGCFLISQETRDIIRDIAEFIRSSELDVTHIEWYDPRVRAFAIAEVENIHENGDFPITVLNDAKYQRPKDVDKIFTFLDAGHSVGSDPAMKSNGHGLMTANLHNMEMSAFTQSIMRERKFLDDPGQKMDLIVCKDALREIDPMIENESTSSNFYSGIRQKKLSINLLKHFVNNTTKDTIKQRAQAIQIQLHGLIVEAIKKWLNDDIATNEGKNQSLLRKSFSEFLIEKKLFELDGWRYLQCRKSTNDAIKNEFDTKLAKMAEIIKDLESNLSSEQFKKMLSDITYVEMRAKKNIKRIPKGEEFLAPLECNRYGDFGHTGAMQEKMQEVEENAEEQTEVNMEQMQEQEINVAQLINQETLAQIGTQIDSKNLRNPTLLFENSEKDNSIPLNAYKYYENHWSHGGENSPKDLEAHFKQFEKTDPCFGEFRKLFGNSFFKSFSYSNNFLRAANVELSVFHGSQICADDALIIWNEDASDIRCIFVAKNDLSEIKNLIENKRLTNCYLATTYANAHVKAELNDEIIEFLDNVKWMSHFFNAEIEILQKNEKKSYEILHEKINFKKYKEAIHHFLMLRSGNCTKCLEEIKNANIIHDEEAKSSILLAAYGDMGNIEMKIDTFFELVLNNNGESLITGNILKAILMYGNTILKNSKKRNMLISKINNQCNSCKEKFLKNILDTLNDNDILTLFLRSDNASLEILQKMCLFILKNDTKRVKSVRNPHMAALFAACVHADPTNPLPLAQVCDFSKNQCKICLSKFKTHFQNINFEQMPICDWASNEIFGNKSDLDEILLFYVGSDQFPNEYATTLYKAICTKKEINKFFSNSADPSYYKKINAFLRMNDRVPESSKKLEISKKIFSSIEAIYKDLESSKFSQLKLIYDEYNALFLYLFNYALSAENGKAIISALLSNPQFNILSEMASKKFIRNPFTSEIIFPHINDPILRKIVDANIENNSKQCVEFIEKFCAGKNWDDTIIRSVFEIYRNKKSNELFEFFIGKFFNSNPSNQVDRKNFVEYFGSKMEEMSEKDFLDAIKRAIPGNNSYQFFRTTISTYITQKNPVKIISAIGARRSKHTKPANSPNEKKIWDKICNIGKEISECADLAKIDIDTALLCLACANKGGLTNEFKKQFLTNRPIDAYDVCIDITIENKFPPINASLVLQKIHDTSPAYPRNYPLSTFIFSCIKFSENLLQDTNAIVAINQLCDKKLVDISGSIDVESSNFIDFAIVFFGKLTDDQKEKAFAVIESNELSARSEIFKKSKEIYEMQNGNNSNNIFSYIAQKKHAYILEILLLIKNSSELFPESMSNRMLDNSIFETSIENFIANCGDDGIKNAIQTICTLNSLQFSKHKSLYSLFISKVTETTQFQKITDINTAKALIKLMFHDQKFVNTILSRFTLNDAIQSNDQQLIAMILLNQNKAEESNYFTEEDTFKFSLLSKITINKTDAKEIIEWITNAKSKRIKNAFVRTLFNYVLNNINYCSLKDAEFHLMLNTIDKIMVSRLRETNLRKFIKEGAARIPNAPDKIKILCDDTPNIASALIKENENLRKAIFFSDWFNPFEAEGYKFMNSDLLNMSNDQLINEEDPEKLKIVLEKCIKTPIKSMQFLEKIYSEKKNDFNKIVSMEFSRNFLDALIEKQAENINCNNDMIIAQFGILGHAEVANLFLPQHSNLLMKIIPNESELLTEICKCFCEKNSENILPNVENNEIKRICTKIIQSASLRRTTDEAIQIPIELQSTNSQENKNQTIPVSKNPINHRNLDSSRPINQDTVEATIEVKTTVNSETQIMVDSNFNRPICKREINLGQLSQGRRSTTTTEDQNQKNLPENTNQLDDKSAQEHISIQQVNSIAAGENSNKSDNETTNKSQENRSTLKSDSENSNKNPIKANSDSTSIASTPLTQTSRQTKIDYPRQSKSSNKKSTPELMIELSENIPENEPRQKNLINSSKNKSTNVSANVDDQSKSQENRSALESDSKDPNENLIQSEIEQIKLTENENTSNMFVNQSPNQDLKKKSTPKISIAVKSSSSENRSNLSDQNKQINSNESISPIENNEDTNQLNTKAMQMQMNTNIQQMNPNSSGKNSAKSEYSNAPMSEEIQCQKGENLPTNEESKSRENSINMPEKKSNLNDQVKQINSDENNTIQSNQNTNPPVNEESQSQKSNENDLPNKTSDTTKTQIADNPDSNQLLSGTNQCQKNFDKSSTALMEKVKQDKYLFIGFSIATMIAVLVALLLLFGAFGTGILPTIAALVGVATAKTLIFAPGAIFLMLTGIFYVRWSQKSSQLGVAQ